MNRLLLCGCHVFQTSTKMASIANDQYAILYDLLYVYFHLIGTFLESDENVSRSLAVIGKGIMC